MDERQRGLAWEMLQPEQILVSFYGGETEDNRWDPYIAMLRALQDKTPVRCVVDVHRDQPPLARIERLLGVVHGKPWRVSMLSSSAAMRFVASSFSLVVRNVRLFAPEALDDALNHLNCSPSEKQRVSACLQRLRAPQG
jgi:hypothetical protein